MIGGGDIMQVTSSSMPAINTIDITIRKIVPIQKISANTKNIQL